VLLSWIANLQYPGIQNNLQCLLSKVAKQFTMFAIEDSKNWQLLLSRIAKQFAILLSWMANLFPILDSKTICNICYPG
jgi:hypothetical protein